MSALLSNLFTLMAEFRGTYYLTQHRAEAPAAAVKQWLQTFSFSILKLTPNEVESLRKDLAVAIPKSQAPDFQSMWSVHAMLGNELFSIHILDTRSDETATS